METYSEEHKSKPKENVAIHELSEKSEEKLKNPNPDGPFSSRSSFIHGLSVGVGIGCIATFIIMWISVFFTPQLPQAVSYEDLLAIFIYPLIYLLAVGLVTLTAGLVMEYHRPKDYGP
ncbi:MAG: hypothetical protein QW667_04710 [Candidatus Bathyarchaeia archaeon]